MAGKLDIYKFGTGGVQLTKGEKHLADTEVLRSQNAELVIDVEKGGEGTLSKRGGYPYLNTIALSGSVVGMAEVRFIAGLTPSSSPLTSTPSSTTNGPNESGITGTLTGGATYHAVLADVSDANYAELQLGPSGTSWDATFGMSVIADPLSNDNFTFYLRLNPAAATGGSITVSLYAGTTLIGAYLLTDADLTFGSFQLYGLSVPAADIYAYRAAGGFATPRAKLSVSANSGAILKISYLALKYEP